MRGAFHALRIPGTIAVPGARPSVAELSNTPTARRLHPLKGPGTQYRTFR